MAGVKKARNEATAGNGPTAIRSRVAGEARLLIQVVDRRYTAQKVLDGLNNGELKYAAGQIRRAGEVVARYQILSIDDRLENFQLAG
jgi:hypothetical protein